MKGKFWANFIAIIALFLSVISIGLQFDFIERTNCNLTLYGGHYNNGKLNIGVLWDNKGNQDVIILDRHIYFTNLIIDTSYYEQNSFLNKDSTLNFNYASLNNFKDNPIYIKPKQQLIDTINFCSCTDDYLTSIFKYVEDSERKDIDFQFNLVVSIYYVDNKGNQSRTWFDLGKIYYNKQVQKIDCDLKLGKKMFTQVIR